MAVDSQNVLDLTDNYTSAMALIVSHITLPVVAYLV